MAKLGMIATSLLLVGAACSSNGNSNETPTPPPPPTPTFTVNQQINSDWQNEYLNGVINQLKFPFAGEMFAANPNFSRLKNITEIHLVVDDTGEFAIIKMAGENASSKWDEEFALYTSDGKENRIERLTIENLEGWSQTYWKKGMNVSDLRLNDFELVVTSGKSPYLMLYAMNGDQIAQKFYIRPGAFDSQVEG